MSTLRRILPRLPLARLFSGTSTPGRFKNATVVGGGAFGTALAQVLGRNGTPTTMWVREEEVAAEINGSHANNRFLPGCPLSPLVTATTDFPASMTAKPEVIFLAVPTPALRAFVSKNHRFLPIGTPLICCSKGIENDTLANPFEILEQELPGARSRRAVVIGVPLCKGSLSMIFANGTHAVGGASAV